MTNPYPITPRQLDLVSLSGSHLTEQGVYPDIKMGVIASYNVSSGSAETVLKSTASGGLTLGSLNVQGNSTLRNVLPENTDTYDLGSSINLWRKGWLSELDTILFAENTAALVGGWLIIGKNQGSIPSFVDSSDTTIDFGKTMIVGGSAVLRSSLQVEYIGTGSLASGSTVYNVVRDLDGSGANDWVEGSVFLELGESGDGRIELNAYDTPRIQMIQQGETYNQQKEIIRIGDLNGNWNYSAEEWGVAIGSYGSGSGNVTIDSINGVRINIYDTSIMEFKSTGAFISNVLNMTGADAAIAIGATPPSGSAIGTGLWLSKNGLYSLNSGSYQVKIDATNGKLYAGEGKVIVDTDGITIVPYYAGYADNTAIKWTSTVDASYEAVRLDVTQSDTGDVKDLSTLNIKAGTYGDSYGGIILQTVLLGATSDYGYEINLSGKAGLTIGRYGTTGIIPVRLEGTLNIVGATYDMNITDGKILTESDIEYNGNLISHKNATDYTGYIFVPLTTPLTSTSYDGGDTVAVGTTNIDTSSVFGAPAGIKGVMVQLSGVWSSANNGYTVSLRPKGGSTNVMIIRAQVANINSDMTGFCPCDANGDLDLVVAGADVTNVVIRIHGYFI